MKKPFKFTEMDEHVKCFTPGCNRPIKKNVVVRKDDGPIICYGCSEIIKKRKRSKR